MPQEKVKRTLLQPTQASKELVEMVRTQRILIIMQGKTRPLQFNLNKRWKHLPLRSCPIPVEEAIVHQENITQTTLLGKLRR